MDEPEQQTSNKRCVLEISELDFIRINQWLKQMIGTKSMSKLSQEMLSMKIDKNIRGHAASGEQVEAMLREFVEYLEQIVAMVADRDKKIELLVSQVKIRSDEIDKMKNQLATVLHQFKAEREKNAVRCAEMTQLLKERENCISDTQKANAAAEHSRKSKMEETIGKLFEKNSEISQLKEQLESIKDELELTRNNLIKSESQLRNVLSVEGFQKPTIRSINDETESIQSDSTLPGVSVRESAVAKSRDQHSTDNPDTMLRFYSLAGLKKPRCSLLNFLGIEDAIKVKTSSMYLYRVISCDFTLIHVLGSSLQNKFNSKAAILEKSLGNR